MFKARGKSFSNIFSNCLDFNNNSKMEGHKKFVLEQKCSYFHCKKKFGLLALELSGEK